MQAFENAHRLRTPARFGRRMSLPNEKRCLTQHPHLKQTGC